MNVDDLVREAEAIHASSHFSSAFEDVVKYVGHRVVEECMREIQAAQIQAPDAQIVKDKVNAQLRILAAQFR